MGPVDEPGASILGRHSTPRRCPIEHPPPDPDKKKYKGLWGRKAEAEQQAKEAAERKKAEKAAAASESAGTSDGTAAPEKPVPSTPPSTATKPEVSGQ